MPSEDDSQFEYMPRGTTRGVKRLDVWGVNIAPFFPPSEPYPNGVPLWPPLGQCAPQAPVAVAPAPRELESAPAVAPAFNIFDEVAVVRQIRAWFSAGRAPRSIAADLNRLGVPVNRGSQWYASTVKGVLLNESYQKAA